MAYLGDTTIGDPDLPAMAKYLRYDLAHRGRVATRSLLTKAMAQEE